MGIERDKKLLKILRISIIALVIVWAGLCVSIGYAKQSSLYEVLNTLKLVPEPERFTELYFENASFLPKETVEGVSDSFSFTVHNMEGATTTYPYRVYFEYPSGHEVTFTENRVSLPDTASTTISVSHAFLASNERGMVVVSLTSLNQSIDFLVPNTN